VLRRLRRPASALAFLLLLVPALAACGSDTKKDTHASSTGTLSGVAVTGGVGKSITAKWHKAIARPKSAKVTTLVKGSGDKIASGDTVSTYVWIANGTTKKVAFSDYQNGQAEPLPNNGQGGPVFDELFKGATYGSRVATVTTAADLLGSAASGSQLGIGANDSIVLVADFVKKAEVSPTPSDSKPHDVSPKALPKVVLKKGKPTGLVWTGIKKPSLTTPVRRVILKKGHGAAVQVSDIVTVNYLGETYKAKKPFGESYSKSALTQPLANFVPGWQIGLAGVKVGSRVLLEVPPVYGYGAQGGGSAIPGNATLWFVIDVLKTKGA
jgi:peptidylprolyl isomerase